MTQIFETNDEGVRRALLQELDIAIEGKMFTGDPKVKSADINDKLVIMFESKSPNDYKIVYALRDAFDAGFKEALRIEGK